MAVNLHTGVPLDLKGFCAHMTEHGKLTNYQMVVFVVLAAHFFPKKRVRMKIKLYLCRRYENSDT